MHKFVFILALSLTGAADAQDSSAHPFVGCKDLQACPISNSHLPNPRKNSLSSMGKALNIGEPDTGGEGLLANLFLGALALANCEISANPESPELTRINWDNVDTISRLDKCVTMKAESLHNHALLATWLQANEFTGLHMSAISEAVMSAGFNLSGTGWRISAGFALDDIPFRLGFFQRMHVYSMSTGIILDSAGNPIRVGTTLNRL